VDPATALRSAQDDRVGVRARPHRRLSGWALRVRQRGRLTSWAFRGRPHRRL